MALALHSSGFDADGIRIVPPTHPEFDKLARPLIGERVADTVLQFKPMLFVVSNDSSRDVVAYSKIWHIAYPHGRTATTRSHTSFAEAVCGDVLISHHPGPLKPGDKWIEAYGIVIQGAGQLDPYYDQFLDQFVKQSQTMSHNALELRVDLNAVIFADGTLIGPDDDAWLTDMFSMRIAAKQDWYRGILHALDSRLSVEEAFQPVADFMADFELNMRAHPTEHFRKLSESGALWKQDAASDAARWRRRFSDDEIPSLLRGAIRLEPFVVRRG